MSATKFAPVASGLERWGAGAVLPGHQHDCAYAAVILAGSYEECGSRGRFRVGPGDVLVHRVFDAHLDRFGQHGAHILNLRLDGGLGDTGLGQIADPDVLVRAAERDASEARAILRAQFREIPGPLDDWPDRLARDLLADAGLSLRDWARRHGLAAATVSRGFRKIFGATPSAFRSQARAHRALAVISDGRETLASIALACGFADQAHMSRALRGLTGSTPRAWRRSNAFKTAAEPTL